MVCSTALQQLHPCWAKWNYVYLSDSWGFYCNRKQKWFFDCFWCVEILFRVRWNKWLVSAYIWHVILLHRMNNSMHFRFSIPSFFSMNGVRGAQTAHSVSNCRRRRICPALVSEDMRTNWKEPSCYETAIAFIICTGILMHEIQLNTKTISNEQWSALNTRMNLNEEKQIESYIARPENLSNKNL